MNNFSIITAIRFLRRSRRFAGIAFLFFALPAFSVFAQSTNSAPSNRWLLIVDTSRAMQPRAEATLQLAAGLVLSGMDGQVLRGDTLGVWTYNDRLYAGNFPVKQLTPDSVKTVARDLATFLRRQKYEGNSDLNTVLSAMTQVVKDSKFITIIFISDGSTKMHGTPFDDKINASYKAWQSEQKKSDMPFVTLLRAKDGRFTDYMVNTPPFPLKIPPLPDELLHPKKSEPPKPAAKPVEKTTLPPLIISGRKPASEKTETNAESAAPEKPASSEKTIEEKPAPVPEPIVVPTPVVTNSESVPATTIESTNAVEQKTEVSGTAINSTSQKTQSTPPNTESNFVSQENHPAEIQKTNAPIETAAAVPPQPDTAHEAFWILAFVVGGIFALIGVMLIRRSRRTRHASLITRSLDRDNK